MNVYFSEKNPFKGTYVYNQGEKDYLKTFAQLTQKDGSFIVSRKDIRTSSRMSVNNKIVHRINNRICLS